MEYVEYIGYHGDCVRYNNFGKAIPPYPRSTYITGIVFDKFRYHVGEGDMWPVTWGADDIIYTAAGDNNGSPMNFWKVREIGSLTKNPMTHTENFRVEIIDNLPINPQEYCTDPQDNRRRGIKPAGLLDVGGTLYFAVEAGNYGTEPLFTRQTNVHGWIITSNDHGQSWNREATDRYFFSGRLASCHFLNCGRGYEDAPDGYVYAYFPGADDGRSYWENGDFMLLGRVPTGLILNRRAWEFFTGTGDAGEPKWSPNDADAVPVFRYEKMTGENHVAYNKGIKRYIFGNYGFVDNELRPRPNHQGSWPECAMRSQLTLYEAPNPWGPWSLFHQDDNWGTYGDYQPAFPTKWMLDDGRVMLMVSSGSWDDYNFVVQKLAIKLQGDSDFPESAKRFGYPFKQ